MVARVGSDLFGPATIENFKKLGIDATHVKQVAGVSSGVAPIFVEPNGQNRIFVVKGANDELKPADVDAAADVLKAVDCIVLQFEIPLETVYYTIAFARKNGIRCILNPAPGQPIDLQVRRGSRLFRPQRKRSRDHHRNAGKESRGRQEVRGETAELRHSPRHHHARLQRSLLAGKRAWNTFRHSR